MDMELDPDFRALPGGEELFPLPDKILKEQSEDAKICYKYVTAEARQDSPPKVVDYRTSSPYHVDKEAWSDQNG